MVVDGYAPDSTQLKDWWLFDAMERADAQRAAIAGAMREAGAARVLTTSGCVLHSMLAPVVE